MDILFLKPGLHYFSNWMVLFSLLLLVMFLCLFILGFLSMCMFRLQFASSKPQFGKCKLSFIPKQHILQSHIDLHLNIILSLIPWFELKQIEVAFLLNQILVCKPLSEHSFTELVNSNVLICRYYTDPSGTFWQCNAKAIGSGSEGADSSLQEQYNKVSMFFSGLFPNFLSCL